MGCPNSLELQSYIDAELNSYRAKIVADHIRICPDCQRLVSQLEQVKSLFKKIRSEEAIPALSVKSTNWFRSKLAAGAAAAVIVLVMSLSGFWYNFHRPENSSPDSELVQEYIVLHNEAEL